MTDKPDKPGPARHWGAGRIAFLTILETVHKDVNQGYPLTVIYQRHAAKLGVSYSSFARYVQRYITEADNAESRPRKQKPTVTAPPKQAEPFPATTPPQPAAEPADPEGGPVIRQFKYNPRAKNPEDLI
ncbi:hypothetical protein [Azospirillum thermophilum]|uniref:TraK oriT-binding protein n=1 Tax=Azospirillum thermophilum TaxID=2202148 RepID=A0A2S2CVU7_9PROT|nr:hypothetical protein [Azospirillum thermophilum]AWK88599.1 hypothetical protein DEW08_21105 [Azospirillum thermophilum]